MDFLLNAFLVIFFVIPILVLIALGVYRYEQEAIRDADKT